MMLGLENVIVMEVRKKVGDWPWGRGGGWLECALLHTIVQIDLGRGILKREQLHKLASLS